MRRKKLFSLLCAAAVTLSTLGGLPAAAEPSGETAEAEAASQVEAYAISGDFEYETNATGITITKYTGGGSTVTIPEEIDGNRVTKIGDYAFENSNITSITIPESVTEIGFSAFSYCKNLTSITIPESVTSIEDYAFRNTAITSVTIPNTIISMGCYVFEQCDKITSVTFQDGVTSIAEGIFCLCTNLTSVTIPNSITSIEDGAFASCSNLTGVTIPNSVTSIGEQAFENCSKLTSITISNNVTSIGAYAFSDCGFTSIMIPNSVTSIGEGILSGCYSLKNIAVDLNNPSYMSVDGVLYSKDGKMLIMYPVGKDTFTILDGVTKIGDGAFAWCDNITSITIPNSVTEIGNSAFEGCCLTNITIPKNVTKIGNSAFDYCWDLKSATILNSNASIGIFSFPKRPNICEIEVIYGYAGSTAEEYANSKSIPFVPIGEVPAAPTFTPDGGTFTEAQTVTIECATEGAEIYYTLDGSVPTASSTRYTAPASVTESAVLKAIAIKDGLSSAVTSADFTVNISAPSKQGFYSDGKTVTEAALGETVTQKTEVKNGKYDVRFIQKVNGGDLSGKSKATFTLVSSEEGKTPQRRSTRKYYTGLTYDDGTKVTAESGQVFLCYTVKDVPAGVTVTATAIDLE